VRSLPHYPYLTRRIIHLFESGVLSRVASIDVEPAYGYVVRINYDDGGHRVTYGNDLGVNAAAASELAKDKGHSKFMLRAIGVEVPDGTEFLLPTWAERVRESPRQATNGAIRDAGEVGAYIENTFGYPAYVKPVDGSKGAGVFKVHNTAELSAAIEALEGEKVRLALVEAPVELPDYRIVTFDGVLISAYRRVPLSVVGDGASTIAHLLHDLRAAFVAAGRDVRIKAGDPRVATHLAQAKLGLRSVPRAGEVVTLLPISNLSTGGAAEDVTAVIHERWAGLARYVAGHFGLRLCGIDLACADITAAGSSHAVFEVNASPGLDQYALSGAAQRQIVDNLYRRVLDAHV
jgi:D-alanine-D-alanine ligase-like ATP-grasp enzyme